MTHRNTVSLVEKCNHFSVLWKLKAFSLCEIFPVKKQRFTGLSQGKNDNVAVAQCRVTSV